VWRTWRHGLFWVRVWSVETRSSFNGDKVTIRVWNWTERGLFQLSGPHTDADTGLECGRKTLCSYAYNASRFDYESSISLLWIKTGNVEILYMSCWWSWTIYYDIHLGCWCNSALNYLNHSSNPTSQRSEELLTIMSQEIWSVWSKMKYSASKLIIQNAKITSFYFQVECTNCHSPSVLHAWTKKGELNEVIIETLVIYAHK